MSPLTAMTSIKTTAPSAAQSIPVSDAASPSASTLGSRLSAFRSLGNNCEFGFVQRYGGIEPSGLLRFSYTPISDLIHGLDTDFAEFGAPGDLRLEVAESKTYYCASRRYNIWSNTARTVGSIDPDALLAREYGRIDYLKRRMLDELASGTKIWVRKLAPGETEADFARLSAAIARHGPSILLRVDAVGSAWQPEPVRPIGERVFSGRVRQFAPQETAWDVDLEPWIRMCDTAYATVYGVPEATFYPDTSADALVFSRKSRRHRSRHSVKTLNSYTRAVDPGSLSPERAYVFSSWVWIPSAADPDRIFAVTGHERLNAQDANLDLRDCWQRVWAAGRFQHGVGPGAVGLGMIGSKRDSFWSRDTRFYEGPVPRPSVAPSSFKDDLLRWLRPF
ncbi:hypothetical protein ACRAWG_30480 [Methylobacterium sp. P31]